MTGIDEQAAPPEPMVGGSALPGGVMMRTQTRVGIAVRHEETGDILTDSFEVDQPRGRWLRWPLARGVWAMHTAVSTGKRAMSLSEKLRWGEQPGEELAVGTWGKIAIGAAALAGAGIQIAAFRVGPVVVAKEAGLTGAAFIVADAFIRLGFLIGTLLVVSYLPPFRRLLAYHGAEHKVIAAFESGAGITPVAAAGRSRFHPRCGTSFLVVSALVSIAVYGAVLAITGIFTYPALILTRILGAPVVTAITFELQRQAARRAHGRWRFLSWPGMAAQQLTTAEPRHEELEVACHALDAALGERSEAPAEAAEPAAPAANALHSPPDAVQPAVPVGDAGDEGIGRLAANDARDAAHGLDAVLHASANVAGGQLDSWIPADPLDLRAVRRARDLERAAIPTREPHRRRGA